MDFDIVKRQIIQEYLKIYGEIRETDEWSLRKCIKVFEYYYTRYYEVIGNEHPHLSNKTISNIIMNLPYFSADEQHGTVYDFSPEQYPALIDAYFSQDFQDCNYSISHFMSGEIRMMRVYESIY